MLLVLLVLVYSSLVLVDVSGLVSPLRGLWSLGTWDWQ